MSSTLYPLYASLTNYTQSEENTYAATLTGQPYGYACIYNTTLFASRVWSGTAFINSPTMLAGSPNSTTISTLSDFPTPVGNVITLKDNTTYLINNNVDIGNNTIVCGIKNTFVSQDRFNNSITSTTSGTMFTCDNSSINKFTLIFNNISIGCPNGTLFNFTSNTANASLNLIDTTITATKNLGTLNNFGGLTLTNTTARSVITNNGFVITGTNTSIRVRFCVFENNVGTFLNLGTSINGIVDINNNSLKINSPQIFLDGTTNGDNISVDGKINSNIFYGGGTYINTITAQDNLWTFSSNVGITNTTTITTGTSIFNFGQEKDTVVNTISSSTITNANIKNISFVNVVNATTTLDDFSLNGVDFNIENIIDNTSFDIRATAQNNASGNYTVKYLITI